MPLWKTWPDLDPTFGFRCWSLFFRSLFLSLVFLFLHHMCCAYHFTFKMLRIVWLYAKFCGPDRVSPPRTKNCHTWGCACMHICFTVLEKGLWMTGEKSSTYPNQVTLIIIMVFCLIPCFWKYLKFMYGVGNSVQSLGAEYVGTLVFLYSE